MGNASRVRRIVTGFAVAVTMLFPLVTDSCADWGDGCQVRAKGYCYKYKDKS